MLNPDLTQAGWELGSAVLSLLNIRAVRKSRSISGVHWIPTGYFFLWGVYNLWFYTALKLPMAYYAGLAITLTNLVWLGHVGYYYVKRRREDETLETNPYEEDGKSSVCYCERASNE